MVYQHGAGFGSLCVVDQSIDAAEFLDSFCNNTGDGFFVCAVCHDWQNLNMVLLLQIFLCLQQTRFGSSGDNQIAALVCECLCQAVADAFTGAGDQCDFSLKSFHKNYPLLFYKNRNDSHRYCYNFITKRGAVSM